MPRSVEIVLSEMLDAIEGSLRAVEGRSFEEFERDWVLRLAIERALEIVSEGSRHIPDELLSTEPGTDWRSIRAIGNVLRHEYHKVSPSIVWSVAMRDLEPLKRVLLRMRDHET